ncbi:uncharacterized protein [Atheta coriaria]|uniref:uncharacterized protein n=1 Tax=Dalotia coriaria TaxID=877792 RepID=UPI0031F4451B
MATTHVKESKRLEFILHGIKQTVDTKNLSPETTLNEYLRDHMHLTGTKYMCREGGCGVCIVSVTAKNPRTGVKETFAVNSCLVSILSCGGWDITTTEGLGNRSDGYHLIQQKIVQFNGTQCGFCTPGMVMNMHALQESGKMTMAEIENSFAGNICRCTGYRPILSAFKSMATDADPKILGIIPDIEELKLCKKENCKKTCPTPCQDVETPLVYELKQDATTNNVVVDSKDVPVPTNKNWFKVSSIKEICDVLKSRGDEDYKLVGGNTGRGVYWDMDKAKYYIDVSGVPELRSISHNTDKLVLGGNVTLTEMMDTFTQVGNSDESFKHLLRAVEHMDLVATVPVRNIGTIAGNLFMKYKHNEFPSDVFLLLETMNAKLVLGSNEKSQTVSPREFLGQNMFKTIIQRIEIPALDSSYKFQSYKIMPKSQNAHAHVNAGFLFKLNADNVVEQANICFGGINPTFVHATNAEKCIIGKQLFNNGNMQALFAKLDTELTPDYELPDPKPDFRKALAIALTYKAILSLAPDTMITKTNMSGSQKLVRPAVSMGTQDYKTNKSMYPIGQPVDKYEAADQASGAAKYIMDLPDLPNQLFAAFVMAKAPAGSIVKSINASKALEMEDVAGFYQASDVEELGGKNTYIAPYSFLPEEEILFVPINGKVQYYFQPLGIIAAKTQRLAELAADMVEIEYTSPTTSPLLNIRDVLSHNETSRITHDHTVVPKHQDLNTPKKIKGKFDINWQYHYHMETQAVSVEPDEDGKYNIHPGTQWMDALQTGITNALKIPAHKLNITVRRCGGSYGAKISRSNWPAVAATLVAMKLQKPVKLWLPFHVNMNIIGCRNPIANDYEVGFDENGKIGFLNHKIYHDTGLHINDLPKEAMMDLLLNTYNSDAMQVDYNYVRTDMHTAAWTRAPGSTEGLAMMEAIMEHISYALGKDPVDVRLANLNVTKYPIIGTMVDDFLKWSDFRARRTAVETFNNENRWRKRGIAMVPMVYNLNFFGNFQCHVAIYQTDGTVTISHGGIEIGQGINTKAVQVVAHSLGIDMNMISVSPSNNLTAANNLATGGSQTSEAVCFAFQKACEVLKKRIDEATTAAKLPADTPWPQKIQNCYNMGVELISNQMWVSDPKNSRAYPIYGVAATEVEVDILTGNLIIQRADIMEDVGDSMSPIIDMGQCEGAYIMGLGYWTSEEMIFDHEGQKMTNRTWTYKPPGCKDIPVDFRVRFPDGMPNPLSPFKTKATGEPPLCLAFSIALAVRHAIRTARTQSDPNADPWVPINGPCSVEWNFMNSLNNYKQYKL